MGDPSELHGMHALCQAHVNPVPAECWYKSRWRCKECMNAVRDANGRTRLHKEAPSKAFVQGHTLPKLVAPSAAPAFREYVVPQSQRDAIAKALEYSWRTLPSKFE